MPSQPISIANVTALNRLQVLNLTGALGFEVTNEVTSLNNYLTLLRAVNPTRRLGVPGLNASLIDKAIAGVPTDSLEEGQGGRPRRKMNTLSADTIASLGRGGFKTPKEFEWDGSLGFVLPLIASLSPAVSDGIMIESLISEERIATEGGVRTPILEEVMRSKTMLPLAWHRFFRTAAAHSVDVPVSMILDPLTAAGNAYEVGAATGGAGTSSARSESYNHLAYFANAGSARPFNGEALSTQLMALFEGTADDAFVNFYNTCLVLDFLHSMPKISAFFAAENMNTVTRDPEQRYAAIAQTARLIRFMSLQPMMFYAKCLYDVMIQPQVREDVSRIQENFYTSDLWSTFAARAEAIKLGHVYRHIWRDVTSGPAVTRYGDTHVVRVPTALAGMFESWNVIIKSVVTAGSSKGQPFVQPPMARGAQDFTLSDPAYFMRYFLRTTGPDEMWTSMASQFTATLGYEAPETAPAVNYLDPPIVMSDGWSASSPVDYTTATRSLVLTPVTFRSGGPAKVALTAVPDLTPADISLESSVERIQVVARELTPDLRTQVVKTGVNALGTERPCLWVVRHAEAHSMYANETFVALNGRMPMAMWNGDLDATIVPHTTFEDFAMDLGMSPRGLAALYTDSARGPALSAMSRRVRAFVRLFFRRVPAENAPASIFATGDDYGMGTVQFSSPAYFISARGAVLQTAALVSLAPVWATDRLTLVTREFASSVARTTVAFRTVTSEPLQPKEHAAALRDVVRLDEMVATAWGATLANPRL